MSRILGATFAATIGAVLPFVGNGVAQAADLPASNYYYGGPPPASLSTSWIGPYVGANAGYEWGWVDHNPTKPSGIEGGVDAGFNWQRGQFVYGLETDIQLSGASDTVAPWQFSTPWFGTLRGRGGIAYGNILLYGTAGLAYGDLRLDTAGLTQSNTNLGWTVGAGLEVSFTPHWSAKAEWLYLDLANSGFSLTNTSNGIAANVVRFGVNYHF
jgi:outer membrane immunogenic protein